MRIAVHADGRTIRGSERQALLLVRGLVERGHDVLVACRGTGPVRDAMDAAGARTTGIRPRGDIDLPSMAAFALWLRRNRVDALLVTSWKRAAVAGAAARLAGVPRVLLRLGGLRGEESGIGSRIRRHALRRWYDGVIVNSGDVRDELIAAGLPADRVTVIANGLAVSNGLPISNGPPGEETTAAPLRSLTGVSAHHLLLVAVSGLERNKGADFLPGILAAQEPDVHLVVAGDGTGEQREALHASARELGVADRLHLLGQRDDVPAILAAADAFVLPSRADSLPNAMLEAMAAGLPVVVSDVGGVRCALGAADGRPAAGWVAPREDAGALAAAVRDVLADLRADGSEARARGAEAAWRARHWYGADRMVREYEAALAGPA